MVYSTGKIIRLCIVILLTNGILFLLYFSLGWIDHDDEKEEKVEDEPHYADRSYGFKIIHKEGWISDNGSNEMYMVRYYVGLHSSTPPIDIESDLTICLTWVDTNPQGNISGETFLTHINNTSPDYNNRFNYTIIADPHNSLAKKGLLDDESQILVYFDFRNLDKNSQPMNKSLNPGSECVVKFIPENKTPTVSAFWVPKSFPKNGGWVYIDWQRR